MCKKDFDDIKEEEEAGGLLSSSGIKTDLAKISMVHCILL